MSDKKRDYIGEVLSGDAGIEKILRSMPPEAAQSVEGFITWIVRSGGAWHDLSHWRWDVRSQAFVRADKDGVEFL